jgi:hypothetical protein
MPEHCLYLIKKEGEKKRQVTCFELPTGSLLDSLGLPVSWQSKRRGQ